jgi:hypothetical protein
VCRAAVANFALEKPFRQKLCVISGIGQVCLSVRIGVQKLLVCIRLQQFRFPPINTFKRKKRKKESIIIRRRGWLQRSNAINDGFVRRALCLWRNFFAAIRQGLR